MTIKTFYKVNNLEFDNLKDAETFDSCLKSFDFIWAIKQKSIIKYILTPN